MKQLGKLRRGFLLMLCAMCLALACAVPAYAENPAPEGCTTPVITCEYHGKFQVAVVIFYNPSNTNMLTVNVNGVVERTPVPANGLPLILDYYLSQDSSISVSAAAWNTNTDDYSISTTAHFTINGYAVPYSTLRVNAASEGANKFSDVPLNAWYRPDVDLLVKAGAIDGMSSRVFAPDGPMTVAQYLKVLLASMYREEMINQYYPGRTWYDPYFKFSVLSINGDGFLSVDEADREISRYEMAVLLAKAYKMYVKPYIYQQALISADPGAIGDFSEIPEQYREAVLICYQKGMLQGMDGSGSFCGNSTLTRCQACTSVVRLFDVI